MYRAVVDLNNTISIIGASEKKALLKSSIIRRKHEIVVVNRMNSSDIRRNSLQTVFTMSGEALASIVHI